MSQPAPWAVGAVGATAFAVGAALGVAAERAFVRRAFDVDADHEADFGSLHIPGVTVRADDGVGLYAEIDEPDDPAAADLTVVFSHGYALNMDEFHDQRRHLRGTARLVFWDQRSHGRSGRGSASSHTIDELGRDLAHVIDECAPEGPVLLVGHSMGGMTIMALADRQPQWFGDRIVGVALLATSSGHMRDVRFGMPGPMAAVFASRVDNVAGGLQARAALIERGRARSNDLGVWLMKVYSFGGRTSRTRSQQASDMVAATPIDVLADFLPELSRHDKVAALSALQQVPTLVMVGDADLLTPPGHSYEIVRRLPEAELVVLPATGHMITMERPDEVDARLDELIGRVRGPSEPPR